MQFQKELWKCDRIDANLTQAEEGELLGTTRQHLSDIEVGRKTPSKRLMALKADLYGRKARYYMGIDDDRIFDRATEVLQEILDMPLSGDEASIREKIHAARIVKAVEIKVGELQRSGMPSEAQTETEKNVNEDLMDEGVDPLAKDE